MNSSDSADAEVGSINDSHNASLIITRVSPTEPPEGDHAEWDHAERDHAERDQTRVYKPPMPIPAPKFPNPPPYWPIIPTEDDWTTAGMGMTGYRNVITGKTRTLNDPPFKPPEYPWIEMGRHLTRQTHRPVAPCYLNKTTGECKWDFPDVPLSSFEFKTPSLNPSEFTKYVKRPQHVRAINAPTHPHTTRTTTNRWGITKPKLKRPVSSAFTAFTRKAGGHKNKRTKRRETKRRETKRRETKRRETKL